MFCQENTLSTAKHPADHTSPRQLDLCYYLFLRSPSKKKKRSLCYVKCDRPDISVPTHTHTIHLVSTHLPSHAQLSTHLSIFLSVAPLICCPVIISQPSKARQSLLSQSAILHFAVADTIFRTPCIKLRSCVFSPPVEATTRRPTL